VTAAENFLREIELYYAMKRSRVAGVLPLKAHTPIPEIQRAIREARKNPRHTTNIRLMMLTPVGLSYQTYLASLVDNGKIRRLTVQQACAMFLDIAEAILQLHKNGILHRDLKCSPFVRQCGIIEIYQ
jgi:kinase domain protein